MTKEETCKKIKKIIKENKSFKKIMNGYSKNDRKVIMNMLIYNNMFIETIRSYKVITYKGHWEGNVWVIEAIKEA